MWSFLDDAKDQLTPHAAQSSKATGSARLVNPPSMNQRTDLYNVTSGGVASMTIIIISQPVDRIALQL